MSPSVSVRLLATQSDKRLLELASKGHERAFEAIVNRYRKPLLTYCGRMGLPDSRSEDVLQQALLRAWLALKGGTEVRELRPWLYRIVHNTAVNVMRGAREEPGTVLDIANLELTPGESELDRRAAVRDALSDVAALPAMQREAVLLSAVDGRTHAEVASAMGISDGAVRGLLYRARAALRGAAAALMPPPLLTWAAGGASRMAPTASRLAEVSSSGGGQLGGVLLKGAAVAVTAALAAGAVLVPLHHKTSAHAAGKREGRPSALLAGAPALLLGPSPAGASTVAGRTLHAVSGTPLAITSPGAGNRTTLPILRTGGAGTHASPTHPADAGQPTPSGPTGPSSNPAVAALGASAGGGPAAEGVPRGSSGGEAVHAPEAPSGKPTEAPAEKPAEGGKLPEGEKAPVGGEKEDASEAERERAEQEAEEARERQEREAEAAHEKAEREAEAAREKEAAAVGKDD